MPAHRKRLPLRRYAQRLLWLVVGLIFLGIGAQKLTAYEAFAVAPIARTSPALAWIYGLAGVRGASFVFAAVELAIGAGLFSGAVRPGGWPARWAAAGAGVTGLITFGFLFTAPGVVVISHGLPLLSLSVGQLFVKDLVLAAAALVLLAESLEARK